MLELIKEFGAEVISVFLFAAMLWVYMRSTKQLSQLKHEIESLRTEVKRLENSLKESESQKSKEVRMKEYTKRQLDEARRELESVRAELQRKNEELMKANEREADLNRREEILRQAEAQKHEEDMQRQQIEQERQEQERLKARAKAQYEMGKKYYYAKDYGRALDFFNISAECGYAEAQCHLGYMYRWGDGVDRDDEEAKKWFRRAAEQGNIQAQETLIRLGEIL